jgi:hypothetical protein
MVLAVLTDDAKKFLFSLILIFILVFIIIGLLGALIQKLMLWQGKKIDTLCADVVKAKVITNKKDLHRYANKKNWALFFKQSAVGLILLLLSFLAILAHYFIYKAWPNVFSFGENNVGGEGFLTLFYIFDFRNPDYYEKFFGITLLNEWPGVINTPHFEVKAICSYIFLPLFATGFVWYLVATLSLISRKIRLFKLGTTIFEKTLEGYNQNDASIPTNNLVKPNNDE